MKRVIIKVILGVIIVAATIGACTGPDKQERTETQVEKAETYEDKIDIRLDGLDVKILDHHTIQGKKTLIITSKKPSGDLYGTRWRATDILEQAFIEPETESVDLIFTDDGVDTYGNTETVKMYTVTMTREQADRIVWDNFSYDNMPNVASEWVHTGWFN